MALIHLARDHRPHGTCTEEELREGVARGTYLASDLVWREGMDAWKLLSEMAPQWQMGVPFAAPPPPLPSAPAAGEEGGPAWEDREAIGLPAALGRTVGAVLTKPTATFASMRRTGGLPGPLLYFVVMMTAAFALFVFFGIVSLRLNPEQAKTLQAMMPGQSLSTISFLLVGDVMLAPAVCVLAAFLLSGAAHLGLKAVGGTPRPFETTFRVICYAAASAASLSILPLFGLPLSLLGACWLTLVGLREAQGISFWKAAAGLVLPGLALGLPLLASLALIAGMMARMGGH